MLTAPLVRYNLEELMSGLFPGANPDSVPLWIDARDVVFDGAAVIPTQGYRNITYQSAFWDSLAGNWDSLVGDWDDLSGLTTLSQTMSTPVRGAWQQIQSNGERLIIWASDTDLYMFYAGSTSTVTRVSGAYTGTKAWSFAQWGDWVLATNGTDKPQVLKGPAAANFVDLANFPVTSAEIVRTLGAHALFFNTSGTYYGTDAGVNQIIWCKEDDVEAWDPSVVGNETAGELTVRDALGGFVAVEQLGNALVAYTEHAAHLVTQVPEFIFGVQRGAVGVRVGGKNAVAVLGDLHYLVSEAGMFATDGLTMTPVAYPKLGDWLKRNVDWSQRSSIAALVNMRQALVKWTLPLDSGTVTITLHGVNQTLSFENKTFVVAARGMGTYPSVVGMSTGIVQELAPTATSTMPELTTKPIAIGEREGLAFIDLLLLRHARLTGLVDYRVGQSQAECEAATWEVLGSVSDVETELYIVQEAVFVQFRLRLDATAEWALSGLELYGKRGGRRF